MNLDQIAGILWLRWRLTRNQWARGGELSAIITGLAVAFALALAFSGGIAGLLIGSGWVSAPVSGRARTTWDFVVLGFLLVWFATLLHELQQPEAIDLTRLLHLPVPLRDIFLLNYLASHLSLTLAITVPFTLGLALGSAFKGGLIFLILPACVAAFFFMITAWTHCLRGWLASLMANPRRQRSIVLIVTLGFVAVMQLPHLILNSWLPRTSQSVRSAHLFQEVIDSAHIAIPFLWLPQSAQSLSEGRPGPAMLCLLGMTAMGALGLARAYRATLRFHRGTYKAAATSRVARAKASKAPARTLLERNLPLAPEEVSVMALGNFRALSRAPELRMAFFMNLFVVATIGAGMLLKSRHGLSEVARPFVATAAVALAYMGMVHVLFNQFGFGREGFRALVLLPTPRARLLLGKNLGLLPFIFLQYVALTALFVALARPPLMLLVETIFQFVAGFFLLSTIGNLISICLPYRIQPGTLKPTKTSAATGFLMLVLTAFFPLLTLPLMLPAGISLAWEKMIGPTGIPLRLLASIALAGIAGVAYSLGLEPIGRLLQSRERSILVKVTEEVE